MEYARRCGVTLAERNATNDYVWNGESIANHYYQRIINGPAVKVYFDDYRLAHEIAHWIVATSEQRRIPEYGMGSALSVCKSLKPYLPRKVWVSQEKRAQRKGLVIYDKCRAPV